jgi:hypothetical protein
MFFRTTKLITVCLPTWLARPFNGAAQERVPVNGQTTADVEFLRKKLEAQMAQ